MPVRNQTRNRDGGNETPIHRHGSHVIGFLHVTLYRWFIFPLLIALSHALQFYQPKIREGLRLRRKIEGRRPWLSGAPHIRPIWFHCSSGELEYAKPVIQLLKQKLPNEKILLTFFSPSVAKSAKNFSSVDLALPVPFDHPLSLQPFLEHHQPKFLALSRTDTWPELVHLSRQRGIPSILFSATLSSSKAKYYNPLSRAYHRWIFDHLTAILCVSPEDEFNFKSIGVQSPSLTTGDTRYDQVLYRLKNPKPLREQLRPSANETVLVAGSTWNEDEEVLVPAIPQLLRYGVRVLIAPHEPTPEHLAQLEAKLSRHNIKSVRYKTASNWPANHVLLIDTVGILAELYQWGTFALVGNSFKKHAVHSVMEPLAAGLVTFFGPYHHNNREAQEFQKIHLRLPPVALAQSVKSSRDLEERILQTMNAPGFSDLRSQIRDEVKKRAGASQRVLEFIQSHLNQN